MEEIAAKHAAAGHKLRVDRHVLSGEARRPSDYYVFALAMLLVYLVLAGQYESWWLPVACFSRCRFRWSGRSRR